MKPPTPRPTRLEFPIPIGRVDKSRRVYCQEYERCLDLADRRRWPSFSCAKCHVRSEIAVEQRRTDAMSVRDILKS